MMAPVTPERESRQTPEALNAKLWVAACRKG